MLFKQKKNYKNGLIKKIQYCFLIVLLLVILFLIKNNYDHTLETDKFANHIFSHVESLENQNKVLYNAIDSLIQAKEGRSSVLEKVCNSIIEDGIELIELAKGYDCLAKIEGEKADPIAIYRAIRNSSYALEAFFNEEYNKNLLSFIIKGYEKEVLLEIGDNPSLDQLIKTNILEVSNRAKYRQSLINSIGKASSFDNYNYNLKLAADLRNEVRKNIDVSNIRYVDLLLSLNNNSEYIQHAKVAIASILLNSDLDTYYNFYIIMDEENLISEENKAILMSLQNISPYKIEFRVLPKNLFHGRSVFSDYKKKILFSRFVAENSFPDLDSIISLDVDIIVLRDLYNLKNSYKLDNFVIAGVAESNKLQNNSSCDFPYTYINAGIVIENLKLMRELNNARNLLSKYENIVNSMSYKCRIYHEQDTLNLLYKDKIKFIPKRWNSLPKLNFSTKHMPFIVHYAGKKPKIFYEIPCEYSKLIYAKYAEFADFYSNKSQ